MDKKDNKNNILLKFSNKFLPSTLPLTAAIIDPTIKLYDQQSTTLIPLDLQ
jgi:hypothetical protein